MNVTMTMDEYSDLVELGRLAEQWKQENALLLKNNMFLHAELLKLRALAGGWQVKVYIDEVKSPGPHALFTDRHIAEEMLGDSGYRGSIHPLEEPRK